ncbi:hypothetical protein PQG83_09660 [Candidatus Nitrospira neomarina]|uniref:Uncharacterized protein n=1 Tax=Candidatus Nitrospira neomarina TaxID=3020899 RepID=A0AA96GP43_9BACT|nr:hypothetical protein [Candidatus Nitrospira neomarina]WNM64000.1 hypothetical protein PQG83_09660 [Candidatus Nitrospira neomarina]
MIRSFRPKAFPRAIIQFIHDLLNLLLSEGGKGPVFEEILANEPIRVFIEPAFPSRVGMGKEEAHLEGLVIVV